jgi:cyclopropane fatty-acyl-phospholipid synthase-like methyltransferase
VCGDQRAKNKKEEIAVMSHASGATETKDMRLHFDEIRAHYDLSDDFFGLFQDPTRKYSSTYFTGPNVTLPEAHHRYVKYLTSCQYSYLDESLDCSLVTHLKPGAVAA